MVVPQESRCGEDRELETSEGLRQPTLSLISNCCEELQRGIQALAVLTEIVSVITTLIDADVDTGDPPKATSEIDGLAYISVHISAALAQCSLTC